MIESSLTNATLCGGRDIDELAALPYLYSFFRDIQNIVRVTRYRPGLDSYNTISVHEKMFNQINSSAQRNSIVSFVSNLHKYSDGNSISTRYHRLDISGRIRMVQSLICGEGLCENDLNEFISNVVTDADGMESHSTTDVTNEINQMYGELNEALNRVSDTITARQGLINLFNIWNSSDLNPMSDEAKRNFSHYQNKFISSFRSRFGNLLISSELESAGGRARNLVESDMTERNNEDGITEFRMKLHSYVSTNDIRDAQAEIVEKIRNNIEDLREQKQEWRRLRFSWGRGRRLDRHRYNDILKSYLKTLIRTSPASVGEYLLNNPTQVDFICTLIRDEAAEREISDDWRNTYLRIGEQSGWVLLGATGTELVTAGITRFALRGAVKAAVREAVNAGGRATARTLTRASLRTLGRTPTRNVRRFANRVIQSRRGTYLQSLTRSVGVVGAGLGVVETGAFRCSRI